VSCRSGASPSDYLPSSGSPSMSGWGTRVRVPHPCTPSMDMDGVPHPRLWSQTTSGEAWQGALYEIRPMPCVRRYRAVAVYLVLLLFCAPPTHPSLPTHPLCSEKGALQVKVGTPSRALACSHARTQKRTRAHKGTLTATARALLAQVSHPKPIHGLEARCIKLPFTTSFTTSGVDRAASARANGAPVY
jgi:hypothetical protein